MKLGLFLKAISIYKEGVALSLALHSLAFTSAFIYWSFPITSSHQQKPLAISIIFITEQKPLMPPHKNSPLNKPVSKFILTSSLSSSDKKTPSFQKKIKQKSVFPSPTIAKNEIAKDISRNCLKYPVHNLNSEKYSPASFESQQINNIQPHYPRRARELGFEGMVVVQVKVSKLGKTAGMKILSSSGYSLLDNAALDALSEWSFMPAKIGCHLIESDLKICIRFSLTDENSTEVMAS